MTPEQRIAELEKRVRDLALQRDLLAIAATGHTAEVIENLLIQGDAALAKAARYRSRLARVLWWMTSHHGTYWRRPSRLRGSSGVWSSTVNGRRG